jgi:long-subunit fatty acid transport protein
MNTKIFTAILLIAAHQLSAQVPEEALRLSWRPQMGTARNQAIGGAMGSLGGDATAAMVNPAGLAFFKTSDIIITPGFGFIKETGVFRGTTSKGSVQNNFNLGTSGFVFGGFGYKAKNSFSITATQVADFNQTVSYKGQNNYSSFAEPLADEFSASKLTIDQALNNSNISLPTKMALYTYLVDTATIGGNKQVIARSEFTSLLNQEHLSQISGGITEITAGFAHELNKKILLGLSIGMPIAKIDRNTYYRESDATSNTDNDFNYIAYRENFNLKGVGFNLKGGLIYRPKEYIRLGLAFHSSDMMMLTETFNSGMAADLEKLFSPNSGYDSVGSLAITGNSAEVYKYTTYTPGKIILSGSYVFREVENINRQKGFITADIEYINYKWMRFGSSEQETNQTKEFYKPFNDAIDATYKSAFNFRLGGELKFKIIMARLGFAWYGKPYKDKELKAGKMNLSAGLGYRHKGMFLDLTYVHHINKDVNFPYRVSAPRANTFANLKDTGGNVLLTVGFKI